MCGGGGDVFQSIGDTLASVDPGPAIGDLGVSIDKTVNDVVPGGWITVAALTAGGLALAYAPEVMAFAEANGITPAAASESLGIAPINAATGEVVAPDVFAGLSANAPVDTTLSQAAANSLAGTGAFTDANLGYTGAAQELGLEGSSTGLTDLSGTQGSAMLDSMGLNSSGRSANDVLNGLSKANQVKNLATTGYNLINGPTASTVKTGLGMLSGTGATTAGAGGTGSGYTESMVNLTPGLTKANQDYSLTGMPTTSENVMHAAKGGSADLFDDKGNYNYNNISDSTLSAILTKPKIDYVLAGLPTLNKAEGGSIHPEFYSEGGASMANRYVKGRGDGTSDSIPAMLAIGVFVIRADVVSGLGNGSNDAGAKVLDEFLSTIRQHKQKHKTSKLPPDSKGALSYLTDAKRKVKA
jgi:hypothetical protein